MKRATRIGTVWLLVLGFLIVAAAQAGPYAPAGGNPGSPAIAATDARIAEWANGATIQRGLREIDNPASGTAYFGGSGGTPASNAPLGPPSLTYPVSLGQGGTATLTFAEPIADGPGYDFAVFNNGFSEGNMEWCKPAFVEVSSNGTDFFRFPAVSLTPTAAQVASYATLDPTNLYDLAGKDPAGWGTPFDLAELAGDAPLLNIHAVRYVRLVDCVGDINPAYATHDSQGNIVNAPWPAPSAAGSEGFDLAGVGVINVAPEPGTWALIVAAAVCAVWMARRNG